MKDRYLLEILASGQPRAYADSIRHVRLTVEYRFDWSNDESDPRIEWKPRDSFTEEEIKDLLRVMKCGFTDTPPENWASTRLDWLKKISPGVWEFHTTSPYTD